MQFNDSFDGMQEYTSGDPGIDVYTTTGHKQYSAIQGATISFWDVMRMYISMIY